MTASIPFGPLRFPDSPESKTDGQFAPAKSSKARILIVDDHDLIRDGIATLLGNRWEICGQAADGLDGVEQVRELRPDLVLLDLSMPVLSGIKAAAMIRKMAPSTKIVFVSMHDAPTVREVAKLAGGNAFVSKRSNAEELRQVVEEVLHSQCKIPDAQCS